MCSIVVINFVYHSFAVENNCKFNFAGTLKDSNWQHSTRGRSYDRAKQTTERKLMIPDLLQAKQNFEKLFHRVKYFLIYILITLI